MKVLKPLQESIKENNVDSFHHHLNELERVIQNKEKMRRLLEKLLSYAAHLGSTPVVETLIQKGVGKEYYNENHNISVETGLIMVTKV